VPNVTAKLRNKQTRWACETQIKGGMSFTVMGSCRLSFGNETDFRPAITWQDISRKQNHPVEADETPRASARQTHQEQREQWH